MKINLKKIILVTLINLMFSNLFCQSFEGTISYKITMDMGEKFKSDSLNNNSSIKNLNDESSFIENITYDYKQGKYRVRFMDGETYITQIYINELNKIFHFEDDFVIAKDASLDLESSMGNLPKITLLEETEVISNRVCNIVKVEWVSGTYYYFFDKSFLIMDSQFYKGHNLDMFYEYLRISNSLPIKIIKEMNEFLTVTLILDTYKKMIIDDSIFILPSMELDKEMNQFAKFNEQIFILN